MKKKIIKTIVITMTAFQMINITACGVHDVERKTSAEESLDDSSKDAEESGATVDTKEQDTGSNPDNKEATDTSTDNSAGDSTDNSKEDTSETESVTTQQTPPQTETVLTPPVVSDEADEFFRNAVFTGDSVMKGFAIYSGRADIGFSTSPTFLTAESFSLYWALSPISSKSVHPTYQGHKCLVEDVLATIGAEKLFMFFGINDLVSYTPETIVTKYDQFINVIKAKNPNIQIYVMSTTNIAQGANKGYLNNANITDLNNRMKTYCQNNGYGYVDITSYLIDSTGSLRADLCSDGYVHQKPAAYAIWTSALRNYAKAQMGLN